MSVRRCYFIVYDDSSFSRLPKKKFYDIILQRDRALCPEFKGQRIKYAEICVRYDGRRPLGVVRGDYGYMAFDADGRFDSGEWDEHFNITVMQTWSIPKVDEPHAEKKLDAETEDYVQRKFHWQPTPTLRDQLYEAALHNQLVGGARN